MREPPASGALRLPALHRGFFAQAAGPPRLENRTRSIRRLKSAGGVLSSEIDSQFYVTKEETIVKYRPIDSDTVSPGAAQHVVMRCRRGIAESSEHVRVEPAKTPDQRCTAARCTASGKRLRYHPRNPARFTGPSNNPPISFSASAARASVQPPCLALSRNLSSMSARVSGSCAPPRI